MKSPTLGIFIVLFLTSALPLSAADVPRSADPNIVLIVADDLGYGDVGAYGASKIKTPNIDGLAREGIRLMDAHAPNAICEPSRYAILSGTYSMRAQLPWMADLYFMKGR